MATEHQLFFHDTIGEATVKVQRDESESESTSQKLADDGKVYNHLDCRSVGVGRHS